MVANRAHDDGSFVVRHAQPLQHLHGDQRAGLSVRVPVNDVARIVQEARQLCQLCDAFGITQADQDIVRDAADQARMTQAVLGISQQSHLLVGPLQERDDQCILLDIFNADRR